MTVKAYHDGVMLLGPELPGQLVRGAPVRGVVAGQVDLVRDLERSRLILDGRHILVLEQPGNGFQVTTGAYRKSQLSIVFVQLIHRLMRTKNQLYKNPNII